MKLFEYIYVLKISQKLCLLTVFGLKMKLQQNSANSLIDIIIHHSVLIINDLNINKALKCHNYDCTNILFVMKFREYF